MQHGEIWWGNITSPTGRRPVLLLSRDQAYKIRTSITIAPITRTIRNIPTEVELGSDDGMQTKCVVNVDNIMTVPKSALTTKITTLSQSKMKKVNEAIIFALDLKI